MATKILTPDIFEAIVTGHVGANGCLQTANSGWQEELDGIVYELHELGYLDFYLDTTYDASGKAENDMEVKFDVRTPWEKVSLHYNDYFQPLEEIPDDDQYYSRIFLQLMEMNKLAKQTRQYFETHKT